ncbi:unnamed protein product [Camellia sinensis]
MAKKRAVRALLTETNQAEVPLAAQTQETVVALPTHQPSTSRASKRARTSTTEPRLVDEDETVVPQTTPPSPPPKRSDRAISSKWVVKITFQNRVINDSDSVVSEKDYLMAFNLAKSVCLPADMEHHDHLIELKAIRSATKSMVLAIQKNHITHKRVLELRKTTRQAMVEVNEKTVELKKSQQKMVKLETEVAQLTGLVTSADADKQKALAVMKDKYLRELAKLDGKKSAEIEEPKKKAEDAEDRGYKEGETTYIKQCEATKDLFFKCGWGAAVAQLDHGPETEVFNPPSYFIPSSMVEYAAIQQQFLQEEEDGDVAPEDNTQPGRQSSSPTPVVSIPPLLAASDVMPSTELDLEMLTTTELPLGEDRVVVDADLNDLFS